MLIPARMTNHSGIYEFSFSQNVMDGINSSVFLPERPAMVQGLPVHKVKLRGWAAADWTVPGVTYPPVQVARVKTFKALVQRHPTLK